MNFKYIFNFNGKNNPFYGRHHTEETKRKIAEKQKGNKYHLGKTVSEEGRARMRQAQLKGNNWMRGRCKENHPNWKNGIHRDKHVGKDYEDWRNAVFERDNYTCQKCKIKGGNLNAHHIKEWSEYPELRYELFNGITLCEIPCHKEIHFTL